MNLLDQILGRTDTPVHEIFVGSSMPAESQKKLLESHLYLKDQFAQYTQVYQAISEIKDKLSAMSESERTALGVKPGAIERLENAKLFYMKDIVHQDDLYASIIPEEDKAYILFNNHIDQLPYEHVRKIMAHEVGHFLEYSEKDLRKQKVSKFVSDVFGSPFRLDNYAKMASGGVAGAVLATGWLGVASLLRYKHGKDQRDEEDFGDKLADALFPDVSMREIFNVKDDKGVLSEWSRIADRAFNAVTGHSHPLEADRAEASDARIAAQQASLKSVAEDEGKGQSASR